MRSRACPTCAARPKNTRINMNSWVRIGGSPSLAAGEARDSDARDSFDRYPERAGRARFERCEAPPSEPAVAAKVMFSARRRLWTFRLRSRPRHEHKGRRVVRRLCKGSDPRFHPAGRAHGPPCLRPQRRPVAIWRSSGGVPINVKAGPTSCAASQCVGYRHCARHALARRNIRRRNRPSRRPEMPQSRHMCAADHPPVVSGLPP